MFFHLQALTATLWVHLFFSCSAARRTGGNFCRTWLSKGRLSEVKHVSLSRCGSGRESLKPAPLPWLRLAALGRRRVLKVTLSETMNSFVKLCRFFIPTLKGTIDALSSIGSCQGYVSRLCSQRCRPQRLGSSSPGKGETKSAAVTPAELLALCENCRKERKSSALVNFQALKINLVNLNKK